MTSLPKRSIERSMRARLDRQDVRDVADYFPAFYKIEGTEGARPPASSPPSSSTPLFPNGYARARAGAVVPLQA